MDKAKGAVRDFMHKSGHHDTTVHETVDPTVVHETVKPTHHENVNVAVDKEVHQDHYHRTVQPVHDKEILPEEHKHKLGAVEHREFDHRDHENTKRALATEGEKFKDERAVHDTTHTKSNAPVVQGEHVHHHLHETIQPVLHKEVVQPSVVHTTVPIHETHHNAAQHHSTSTLPAVSMDDYKKHGGVLGGDRKERFDRFEGEGKNIGDILGKTHGHNDTQTQSPPKGVFHGDFHPLDGEKGQHGHHNTSTTGSYTTSNTGHHTTGQTTGATGTTGGASSAPRNAAPGSSVPSGTSGSTGLGNSGASTTTKKPSLMDKLNPMVDSNGDGKAGFMK
ncbi:hypothetical protein BJ170DRAFT_688531 [Xylariales sp. AK1849]|nr:hypothetical protein BJ170DRAFT_688531 [Xylariales sp. AK1849]